VGATVGEVAVVAAEAPRGMTSASTAKALATGPTSAPTRLERGRAAEGEVEEGEDAPTAGLGHPGGAVATVEEDVEIGVEGVTGVDLEGEVDVVVTGERIEGEGTGPLLLTPSRDPRGDHPPVVPTPLIGQEAMEETRRRDHPGDQSKPRGAKDPSQAGARASSE